MYIKTNFYYETPYLLIYVLICDQCTGEYIEQIGEQVKGRPNIHWKHIRQPRYQ